MWLVARAGALMSSAGEKTSRKDYSEVLEVRGRGGTWSHRLP